MSTKIVEIQEGTGAGSFRELVSSLNRNDNDVFKIKLSGQYTTQPRDFQGIELLKWLRANGFINHCILTSSSSLVDLLRVDPKYAIIASRGTTFVDLRSSVDLSLNNPTSLAKAEPRQIKELFRLDIDLKAIRHDQANMYGLHKLRNHHLEIEAATFCPATLETDDDLMHEIVRFVFGSASNWRPLPNQIAGARTKLARLRGIPDKKIIFVDDKAEKGWGDFLRVLLGSCSFKEIVPGAKSTALALSEEVLKFINEAGREWIDFVNGSHLYISDLKLLETERLTTDYKTLLSYGTIKLLRTGDRLRVMYLTASNDLSKVKGMLDDKAFNPHLIFTKEGADQLLDAEQSFAKYLELLDSLYTLLGPIPKKKMLENLQILNLEEENRKQALADDLVLMYEDQLNRHNQITLSGPISEASQIYLDTNIFLNNRLAKPLIELLVSQKEKIRIPATVRHELRCIGENSEEKRGTEEIPAVFFCKLIDELQIKPVEACLTSEQNSIIAKNSCKYPKDFADRHIVALMKVTTDHQTFLLTRDGDVIKSVSNLKNECVTIKRDLGYTVNRDNPPTREVGERNRDRGRTNPASRRGTRSRAPYTFEVAKVYLSTPTKSYVFYEPDNPKPVFSIRTSDLPDASLEDLVAKVVGRVLKSNSSGSDVRELLGS